jgi:hypothetical protein
MEKDLLVEFITQGLKSELDTDKSLSELVDDRKPPAMLKAYSLDDDRKLPALPNVDALTLLLLRIASLQRKVIQPLGWFGFHRDLSLEAQGSTKAETYNKVRTNIGATRIRS